MPQRFFELADDVNVPRRWHLAMPCDSQGLKVDDYAFWRGSPVSLKGRLRIPIEMEGNPLDYTEAGINIPVVHVRVASLLAEMAPSDVQLVPVDVEGQPEQYLILVATRRIHCIDEKASRFVPWTPKDGELSTVRRYSIMYELRLDRAQVGSAQVFRCADWEGPLIVSEQIKAALERMGATGLRFEEV